MQTLRPMNKWFFACPTCKCLTEFHEVNLATQKHPQRAFKCFLEETENA